MTWIWHLCFTNMKQRGVRTFLTILGVVIGIISIVSLLAIGIGMKTELLSMVEASGSVTEITIYGVSEGKRTDRMLTDRKINDVAGLEYVTAAYPCLSVMVVAEYNQYTGYVSLEGRPESYLAQMKLEEGAIPEDNGVKPELLLGGHAMDMFINQGTGLSYTEMNKKDEDEDTSEDEAQEDEFTGETLHVRMNYMDEDAPKYRLKVCGVTDKDAYQYDMYCNIDVLKKYLKRLAGQDGIPGQPKDANGKNYSGWVYDSAIVKVDDAEHVEKVTKKLQDMGFQTVSNKEFLDSTQRTLKIFQVLLGGIGMIALVVAVIGIGNTMTTSVYDRINEIGILKVLGSDPDELLYLFLLESGILGGLGGLIGILLSYGVTEFGINKLGVKLLEMQKGTQLAVIPVWLAVSAFLFSVILGVAAGYFPAKWASRLKPIDAVRNNF